MIPNAITDKVKNQHLSSSDTAVLLNKPVLFVVDSYFPVIAGAERQALVLARALRKRGLTVEFVVPRLETHRPVNDSVEGFSVRRIAYPKIKFLGALILMVNFSMYIIRHRNRYSYIHVHITKLLATCLGILKPWIHPRIITKISGYSEFSGGVLDQSMQKKPAYRIMKHYILKLDFVHTISNYTRDVLLECGFRDEQIIQIPNAVEIETFESAHSISRSDRVIRIGFCGRVEHVKGLDVLIDACSKLQADDLQRIKVLIAGKGSYLPDIKKRVEEHQLQGCVEFAGMVENVAAFHQTLDIYVQPSYSEGLSNAVLEAMSSSLPVIASNVSGNVDLVKEGITGSLFESGDSDDLAEKLTMLINDPSQRIRMGSQGRQRIEHGFSIESISNQLIEFYSHG